MRRLVCILAVLLVAYGEDFVQYEGLRLDLSALTLNRDILGTIIPALNRTKMAGFGTYKEYGSFWHELRVSNVKITSYTINEHRFDMNSYTYSYPTYTLRGTSEAIYFKISFSYRMTCLGIITNAGTGTADVTNVRNEILVFWNESDPDVLIPHPWDIKNLYLSSWFPPTNWITSILHNQFVKDFHVVVDRAMDDFAHNLLRTYRRIEDYFPHRVELVLFNDIISANSTVDGKYFSIAFKTDITVDRYVKKPMYRRMNGTVVPRGNFDYCFSAQLVPDVMDAMGKGAYYDKEVPVDVWGFGSDEIREFFNIVPSLREKYDPHDKFAISCMSSRFETINDITQRTLPAPLLQLQYPAYCMTLTRKDGRIFLIIDVFARFYYELKAKIDEKNTTEPPVYYGHVRASTLGGFTVSPSLPENKKNLLLDHVLAYVGSFFDQELVSPGLSLRPNRESELQYASAYIMDEEICFYFNEKRPQI